MALRPSAQSPTCLSVVLAAWLAFWQLACVGPTATEPPTSVPPPARDAGQDAAEASRRAAGDPATLDVTAPLRRIGFGSCLGQGEPQPILDTVLDRDFDLFLMLGDNVYGDVTDTDTMAELIEAYAVQATTDGFRRLRAATPLLAVWDDHDYGLNDAGASFAGREAAERLFDEFWRIPADAPSRGWPGIYDAHLVGPPGQRVQILRLDTRYFRSDLTLSPDQDVARYVPVEDPDATLLGEAQWRWLDEQLCQPADLRLLVSSIQVIADGHGWEAWRLMPDERQRLYETIERSGAAGLIVLSGDRHRAGIYRRDDAIGYPLYEVTSSSLNRPTSSPEEPGPHRLGPTFRKENFGAVTVDWRTRMVRLEVADIDGATVLTQSIDLDELTPRR